MPTQSGVKLIVGLGNPGPKYARTRHNVGFMAVDQLMSTWSFPSPKSRFRAEISEGRIGQHRVVIVKPQTYMNDSGIAVQQAVNWFKPLLEDVLIINDDIDLPLGAVRIRGKGSSGGQNGLKSIFQHLGTQDIARLRLGIGRSSHEVIGHVLSPFTSDQQVIVTSMLDEAERAVDIWLTDGILNAMNLVNGASK